MEVASELTLLSYCSKCKLFNDIIIISTCKITQIRQIVTLNNPIAPYVFNRNEETKFSLVKNKDF